MNTFFLLFKVPYRIRSRLHKILLKLSGVKIGNNTFTSNLKILDAKKINIGNSTIIEDDTFIRNWSYDSDIKIGNNVFIGRGCEFNIGSKFIIGDYCAIASGCMFIDNNHGTKIGLLIGTQLGIVKSITLKDDVWLGANVVILLGVTIGKGSVVAAGSVVTKSIPDFEIWGGVPAKKIKDRI